MQNFVFTLPTRVAFGAGELQRIGTESAQYGSHALLVTGTTFARRSGLIQRVLDPLEAVDVRVSVFDGIGPNPTTDAVEEGGRLAREAGADLVIGLGGGSTLDAAKAIAVASSTDTPIWHFTTAEVGETRREVTQALPIIQVPIIASTGSETNDAAVVYNELIGIKSSLSSPLLRAKLAIVDPTLTFSVPPRYTAVGGMNIVSQMLETYLSSDEFSVADRMTEGLIQVVMDTLPRAMRQGEDLDARSNLSWAAVMASTVALAGRSPARPLQTLAHPLTARYQVDHGCAVASLWGSYMRYALANRFRLPHVGRFKRYALLGRHIFGVHDTDDEVAAEMTAYRLVHWLRNMEMPTTFMDLGLNAVDAPMLADDALRSVGGRRLSGGLSGEDIEHIYDGALRPL